MLEFFCMILGRKSKTEVVHKNSVCNLFLAHMWLSVICLLGHKLQCRTAFVLSYFCLQTTKWAWKTNLW